MIFSLRRLLAYWLDFVLLAAMLVSAQVLLNAITAGFPFAYLETGFAIEGWVLLSMSLPVWGYFIICEKVTGQTVGKRLLKLRVADKDGSNIRWTQAFIRTLIRLLPWEMTHLILLVPTPWWSGAEPHNPYWILLPNLLILVYTVCLFVNKGNKAIHDYVAKTTVVETIRHRTGR